MLKRAASTREAASPSPSSSRTGSPILPRSVSSATARHRSRTISSANPAFTDEDTSLFLAPASDSASALERTASLLARQLALAKLTGTAPPTPPPTFFTPDEPLPTLAELQERARAKFARERNPLAAVPLQRNNTVATTAGVAASAASVLNGLKRNNTVTGVGTGGIEVPEQAVGVDEDQRLTGGREQARVNLMRKLSARRLEAPEQKKDRLGVVGRIGRARPRSGSVSALDWQSYLPHPPAPPANPPPASSVAAPFPPVHASAAPLPPPLAIPYSDGIGIGISIPQPFSVATDRSETPISVRSSGSAAEGSWAAERDRHSVLARASGEEAWEFEDALRSDRQQGREGIEDDGRGEAEILRDSQVPAGMAGEETTPRAGRGDEEAFSIPHQYTPRLADDDVSPRGTPGARPNEWQSSLPFLAPPVSSSPSTSTLRHDTFRSGTASGSSSSASSAAPSPGPLPDTSRRSPFLPSFGIAAVEEEPFRKRGSSASSSIAGQLLDGRRFRGSDALLASGQLGRRSIVSTTSMQDEEDPEEEEELLHDERAVQIDPAVEESTLGPKELRLLDKVEKKREAAVERAKSPDADKGAFPPPIEGYQFPSPRQSTDDRATKERQDPQQLFQQLTSSAPSTSPVPAPASPPRKGRDFPFKLHYQPFGPNAVNLPPSPRLPDPISPTHIIPDPMASLVIPHTSPRPATSPSPSTRARFSPSATRNGGGVGMDRSHSQQSKYSHTMIKSPSTESTASFHSVGASSYHSPVHMRRDLSSSSRSDDFPSSPRVPRLPAEYLPSNRILAKLDSIIGPEAVNSDEPSPLDAPPRRLLLHGGVLQVVNANTVKDRHLFLFDDLLVIAKPLIEDHPLTGEPILPTLDSRFLVKSIVDFKNLKLAAAEDPAEEAANTAVGSKKRHPLLVAFVDRFANDPSRAIASLVQKGGLANDGPTIANLLFRNTDLNRNQLGAYLANPNHRHVLRAYIERFRFQGVRIDDALRLFCMTVRLPHDVKEAEYVLGVLASNWTESNGATGFDPSLTFSLVMAILKLSDALHGGSDSNGSNSTFFPQYSSSSPTPPSVDDFIGAFREHDTRLVVPEDLLSRIYTSVRRERIEQASDNSIFSMTPDIEAIIEPAKLSTRLTYRSPSDVFTITIPEPDPKFTIKLHGNDLQFHPPVLSFARSNTQSFRVTGNALGVRVMVLIKRGANAPRYQGLPLNKAFSIERGFMQHTFQVSFTNHLDLKRKYMFSTADAALRMRWLRLLRERIIAALDQPAPASRALAAANAVSVQVLRDVFLPPDEPVLQVPSAAPSPRPNLAAPRFGPPVTPAPPRTAGTRVGTPTRPGGQLVRSNSVSKLYAAQFKHEADFGNALERRNGSIAPASLAALGASGRNGGGSGGRDDPAALEAGAPYIKTGHELVVTTEQNSLLPMLVSFLNAGLEAAPHPVSLQGSAFQLPPLPPANNTNQNHPAVSFASFISPHRAL
ncbi:hypothetical protein JCM8547_006358 [Rhodosporidiobolus lusitaniae]